jgi:hypothetical protein
MREGSHPSRVIPIRTALATFFQVEGRLDEDDISIRRCPFQHDALLLRRRYAARDDKQGAGKAYTGKLFLQNDAP